MTTPPDHEERKPPPEEILERAHEMTAERDRLLAEAAQINALIEELIATEEAKGPRRRPRLSVRALCVEALAGKRRGMTPIEVKNSILEKYPERNCVTFYHQVYINLMRSADFRKLKNGRFVLLAGAAARAAKR